MDTLDMAVLTMPNRLDTIGSGYTEWNTILSANMESLNVLIPLLRAAVTSRSTKEPPVSIPGTSPMYYVPEGGTGVFEGHDYQFAVYNPTTKAFVFIKPTDGFSFYVLDSEEYVILRRYTLTQNRIVCKPAYIVQTVAVK